MFDTYGGVSGYAGLGNNVYEFHRTQYEYSSSWWDPPGYCVCTVLGKDTYTQYRKLMGAGSSRCEPQSAGHLAETPV